MDRTKAEREFLTGILQGVEEAVDLCVTLGEIAQKWDDIIDGDAEPTPENISALVLLVIGELNRNPFYQRHIGELQPLIEVSIVDWLTANQFEKGDYHERTLAFVLRDSLHSIVIHMARIIGGMRWAVEVSPDIRRFFHDEGLTEYLAELSL